MATKDELVDRAAQLGVTVEENDTKADIERKIAQAESRPDDGVASPAENAELEHSAGGTTTRSDRTDAGAPMLPGSPSEPVGPEDALGKGPKRGDYTDRVDGNPHETERIADGGGPVTQWVDRETGAPAKEGDKGAIEVPADNAPHTQLEAQRPRTEDRGEVEGKKGGVDSAEPAAA